MVSPQGFILVDKPQGITSFDVVYKIRRLFPKCKVGHGGTLDPLATGLLVLAVGKATKQIDQFINDDKEYVAQFSLGQSTDTQDSTGTVIEEHDVGTISQEQLDEVCQQFRGAIEQVPPMYSAKKVGGKRLYSLARKGKVVEREPRSIQIHELEIVEFDGQSGTMRVSCSKGTYVRTLCHDIGHQLAVGGHMTGLVRTRSGSFLLEDAHTIEELEQMTLEERVQSFVTPVTASLQR